ncbi:MAG: GYD domain-containing protein [Defluviicoccus sp.]
MPTYIMLSNWTDQGIRHVNDSPDRLDAARELCRQHGAEITACYLTMGAYDLVLIVDAPNDETFAKIALSLGKGGNVRTNSLKAFDEAEYRQVIGALG